MSEDFKETLQKAKAKIIAEQEAIEGAIDKSNKAKDVILEHMAGIYFRVEQLRALTNSSVTVAELVDAMPERGRQTIQAVKYAWTQDYMVEAFYKIMKEDGEPVDTKILGNLKAITAPDGPVRVKV